MLYGASPLAGSLASMRGADIDMHRILTCTEDLVRYL